MATIRAGQTYRFEGVTFEDEKTHRPVRRLTGLDYRSHHPYFYFNMWTPDGRRLLVASNRGDGVYRHYLLDVESGEGLCLTDDPAVTMTGTHMIDMAQDGSHVFYAAGRELRRLDLADRSEAVLYRAEPPWDSHVYFSPTADHTRVVMVEMHAEDRRMAGKGWETMEAQWRCRPRCRLVELDAASGKWSVIHEDRCWLGHPNYRPDGGRIMFCHEGPWNLVDARLWFIQPDGSNVRCGRQREPGRPPGPDAEQWGHEFWLPDSSRAAYIWFPGRYGVDGRLRFLDDQTLAEEDVMESGPTSHIMASRDGRWMVGDGFSSRSDEVFLFNLAARKRLTVCRHGSSSRPYKDERTGEVNTQAAHAHAAFDPPAQRVVFTSDRDGSPAVYVTDVRDLMNR